MRLALVIGAVGARHCCGWRSSLVRLALVIGAIGARHWCGWLSSLVRLTLVTGAVGCRHRWGWLSSLVRLALVIHEVGAVQWCGSRQFHVKKKSCMISGFCRDVSEIRALSRCVTPQKSADIRIQQVYMHTRLTAMGVLKGLRRLGQFLCLSSGVFRCTHSSIRTELVPS